MRRVRNGRDEMPQRICPRGASVSTLGRASGARIDEAPWCSLERLWAASGDVVRAVKARRLR
jgi:hypothetical protein